MANERRKDDAETPPRPGGDDEKRERERRERRERDERPRNGELDEGLDETFPASDPPAPVRPTGEV